MKQTIEIEVSEDKKTIWKDNKIIFEDIKPQLYKLNKENKFNPNTLQPFDKVLIREHSNCVWKCNLFSHIAGIKECYPCRCISGVYKYCIPYNDDTKYLINTTEEAPEYYRYWED